jgi:hypothetical protein
MDRDSLLSMDANILLSIINMKLRDKFSSLNDLCEDVGISEDEIFEKLKCTGRTYNVNENQFK